MTNLSSGPNRRTTCAYRGFFQLLKPAASLLGAIAMATALSAADFTVTTPGYLYAINGAQPNPTLTLVRGKTYSFDINADPIHPFFIQSGGVYNNNITSGTMYFTVPNVATNYSYFCSVHYFGGQIVTIAPPPPPPPKVKFLSLTVSSNLTFYSTGTNTWSVKPQYSTNLATTNWFALTVITNRYLNGTNETICGLPPGKSVVLRILAQPN